MKTTLAIALLIAGWTLIYVGFKGGSVLTEVQAGLGGRRRERVR